MNVTTLLLVAAGGAIGSVLRALATYALPSGRLPWATIVVNVVGSLLIGVILARVSMSEGSTPNGVHAFWVVGVCGGFTTFSAFSWQTFDQLQRGDWVAVITHVLVSVAVCVAATSVGWRLAR